MNIKVATCGTQRRDWKREKMEHAKKKRYHILDSIRGITLISMIGFHAVWDLVYIFDVDWAWFETPIAYIWQQSICWVFIALSGFCWSLGRRKLRRGLTVLAAGFLVSLATEIFMPDQVVRFGVLTLLGCSMLLTIPLDKVLNERAKASDDSWAAEDGLAKGKSMGKRELKFSAVTGLGASLLAFFLTRNINDGSLGFESLNLIKLPRALYQMGDAGNFLGFTEPRFYSADYFSLLPWFFLFLAGYFGYYLAVQKGAMEKAAARKPLPKMFGWVDFIGKHSLIIYMLHQPVIYGVLYLLFWL